ncbi:MAG: helix-turn-helix domain-containing protein [Fimbriimonas sp.]
MEHIPRYSFMGATRLARDAGVSKSAVSRLIRGETSPSFAIIARIATALEKECGVAIDPRQIVSENGDWSVPFVCELMACGNGCLPSWVYDRDDRIRPMHAHVLPGRWSGDPRELINPKPNP